MTLVCPECFADRGLGRRIVEIRPSYPDQKCDFHQRRKGIPLEAVAPIVDVVFRNNYGFGHYRSMLDEFTGESLDDVLSDLTGANHQTVTEALVQELIRGDSYWPGGEPFYQRDASYERTDVAFGGHGLMWAKFRRSIIHEHRFFNEAAKNLLREIFDGIHRQRDTSKRQPIVTLEPGSAEARVIRARIADSNSLRKNIAQDPVVHMGAPPMRSRRPGRMNPSGICAFYAAYDLLTCLAELRPSVGSIVVCAEFELVRPIVALDMTKFDGQLKEPNLFAKDHVKRLAQWRFMQSFMHEVAQPISPDDEHLEYIPTQAVAEYLLRHHKFPINGVQQSIEAIIFRSAQHPIGRNVVILGDATTVEPVTSDRSGQPSGMGAAFDAMRDDLRARDPMDPEPRLRYVRDSLAYYRIGGASFDPERFYDVSDHEEF